MGGARKRATTGSDRIWSVFESSVFNVAAVMRGADVGAKASAVSNLQSLAEDIQRALRNEEEG
jgi:hypothetical protein